jgi:hypothetical protein
MTSPAHREAHREEADRLQGIGAMTGTPPITDRARQLQRLALGALIGLLAGMVLLLFPLLQARRSAAELRHQLHVVGLENQLARTALMARQGEYPAARDAASAFFTAASEELASETASDGRTEALRALLQDRDHVITLLARGDPAGADRAGEMYLSYRNAPVH